MKRIDLTGGPRDTQGATTSRWTRALGAVCALTFAGVTTSASATTVQYDWHWSCYWQCSNIGLNTGDTVTGWAIFQGEPPPSQDPYAYSFAGPAVVDYRFNLGSYVLDPGNTDIQRWNLSTMPPAMTFTGGDLVGIVNLTWKGTDGRALGLFDDSDVYWVLDSGGTDWSGFGTDYIAAGPVPRPLSNPDEWRGAYPGGWHFAGVIPVPGTAPLIVLGLAGLFSARRRRKVDGAFPVVGFRVTGAMR